MVSFDRELHANYFDAKIRKIESVTKPVEGFKVKVSFFLGHPVVVGCRKFKWKMLWRVLYGILLCKVFGIKICPMIFTKNDTSCKVPNKLIVSQKAQT